MQAESNDKRIGVTHWVAPIFILVKLCVFGTLHIPQRDIIGLFYINMMFTSAKYDSYMWKVSSVSVCLVSCAMMLRITVASVISCCSVIILVLLIWFLIFFRCAKLIIIFVGIWHKWHTKLKNARQNVNN